MASASNSRPAGAAKVTPASEAKKKKKKKPKTPVPMVTYPGGNFEYYDDAGKIVTRYLDDDEIVLIAELLNQQP